MENSTKELLTTIAENQPKIKAQGFEEGKKAEYDEFWDNIQQNGNRTEYASAFREWGAEEITPKYKVVPTGQASLCFHHCRNLKTINPELFDFSQAVYQPTGSSSAAYGLFDTCSKLQYLPDIGLQAGCYVSAFAYCNVLHTIDVLRVNDDVTFGNQCFIACRALKNITIEGVIGKTIDFKYSPLSSASLKSIVKHLKNYLGTSNEYAYTLTVKTSAWEALVSAGCTDEDFAWIEETFGISKSLWEEFGFTWTDIAGYLRWNLVLA